MTSNRRLENYSQITLNEQTSEEKSKLRYFIFLNPGSVDTFHLTIYFKDKPFNSLEYPLTELSKTLIFQKIEIEVPDSHKRLFLEKSQSKNLKYSFYSIDKTRNTKRALNYQMGKFSFEQPTFIFYFNEKFDFQNSTSLSSSLLFMINYFKARDEKTDSIEFLDKLWEVKPKDFLFENIEFLKYHLSKMTVDIGDYFDYYMIALTFFSTDTIKYCHSEIQNILMTNEQQMIDFYLNFNDLFPFISENFKRSIIKVISDITCLLPQYQNKNSMLQIIQKSYKRLENTNKSQYMIEIINSIVTNSKTKNSVFDVSEIEFIIKCQDNPNSELIKLTKNYVDLLLIIPKLPNSQNMKNTISDHLINLLKEGNYQQFDQSKIINFFIMCSSIEENKINEIFKSQELKQILLDFIIKSINKNILTEIFPSLVKFVKIFDYYLIYFILSKSRSNEMEITFIKLFQLVVTDQKMIKLMEEDLRKINGAYPEIIPKNLSNIKSILDTNNIPYNILDTIFEILEISLFNFKNTEKMKHFIDKVYNDKIIEMSVEFIIRRELKRNDRYTNRKKIVYELKLQAKDYSVGLKWKIPAFIEYMKNDNLMNVHLDKLEPDKVMKSIFENFDPIETDKIIQDLKNKDLNETEEYINLKNKIIDEFNNWQNMFCTVSQLSIFINNFQSNDSSFVRLYKTLLNSHDIPDFNYEAFFNSVDLLKTKFSIFRDYCKGCRDQEAFKSRSNINSSDIQKFTVREFIEYSNKLMLDIDWNTIQILIKDHDLIFQLVYEESEDLKCKERLNSILLQMNHVKQKIDHLKVHYKQMTQPKVFETLEIEKLNDFTQYIQNFLCNDPVKEGILKSVNISLNFKYVLEYLDLIEQISKLGFKLKDYQNKLQFIQDFRATNPLNSPLGLLEQLNSTLNNKFEPFEDIKIVLEKYRFFNGFETSFKLLNSMKSDFDRLKEFVTDFQEFDITYDTINDLEVIASFFDELMHNKTDNKVIIFDNMIDFGNRFEKLCTSDPNFKGVNQKIRDFMTNTTQLEEFYQKSSNDKESQIKWIRRLLKKCQIKIVFLNKTMKISISFNNQTNNHNDPNLKDIGREYFYSFEEMEDLRNAIQLKGSLDLNNTKKSKELVSFVHMFRQIEILNNTIGVMCNFGYDPGKDTIEFAIIDNSLESLYQINNLYIAKSKSYKDQISNAYETCFLFTFLHEKMIQHFIDALKNNNLTKIQVHLLKSLGFTNFEEIRTFFNQTTQATNEDNLIPSLVNLLNGEMGQKSLFRKDNTPIPCKAKFDVNTTYLVKVSSNADNLFKSIIGVSFTANSRMIKSHNILFCSQTTLISRLFAFIKRVYHSLTNEAFVIVRPELLSQEAQQEFIKFMYEINEISKRKSFLFVIYSQSNSLFVLSLFEQSKCEEYSPDESVYKNEFGNVIEALKNRVTIITSDQPLVGKTSWINNAIKSSNNHENCKHMRLTGLLNMDFISDQLLEIIDDNKLVFHFDVGPVQDNSLKLLDEILFSLIFFESLTTDKSILIIPKNTTFFIEFDSSKFQNLKRTLEIFNFGFPVIDLSNNNPQQLIPISPIPVFFSEFFKGNLMDNWGYEQLSKLIHIPNNQLELLTAEKNIGLNDSQALFVPQAAIDGNRLNDYTQFLKLGIDSQNGFELLPCQMVLQKIMTFLSLELSKCGLLKEIKNQKAIGELVMTSAKYLAQSSFKTLISKQTKQRELFANQNNNNNLITPDDDQSNEVISWENMNTIFITFNETYPILVFKNETLIPKEILLSCKDNIRFTNISHRPNQLQTNQPQNYVHNKLFSELAHLNNKLLTCKFCEKCCLKFDSNTCSKCRLECTSPDDFWKVNNKSKYFLNIDNNNITPAIKIQSFLTFLKDLLGNESINKLSIKTEKDMVCMTCLTTLKSQTDCVDCKSNKNQNNLNCVKCISEPKFVDKCPECSNDLITKDIYFDKFKDTKRFVDIHNENLKKTNLKKTAYKNGKFYHVFDSDINDGFRDFISENLKNTYVVTEDNYSKMMQIQVRAKSRLPIVIMGETGCGKTSLIRFMCRYVLDDHFELFNMHAGITAKHIIDKVTLFFDHCKRYYNKDCWLVFDEFNTTDAYGLVKTLLVDRRLGNIKVPVNAIFVATCNPFKIKKSNLIDQQIVGLKKELLGVRSERYSLVYTVHPLQESLFHFTFDFGQLSEGDKKQYVNAMLGRTVELNDLHIISEICLKSNHHFKTQFEISSTSLRDLKRFEIIYQFFNNQYFKAIEETGGYWNIERRSSLMKNQKVLVLSVFVNYCLRLSNTEQRNEIIQIVERCSRITSSEFNMVVDEATDHLAKNMELERDIIKNRALNENLFSMFVCLLNKIPLVIIGKPGSSKSLSLQLIFQRLKGSKSPYKFFRKFNELVMVSYQGSEFSTSESIEKVFKRAEDLLKSKDNLVLTRIPVVVFDEIGLAELSINNPLKVLHSKLEIENIQVGFLGISNWELDSSKMNRVLTVSRTDPDLSELKATAVPMCQVIGNGKGCFQKYFIHLATIYWDLKSELIRRGERNQGIAGLRDFYNLIKFTAKEYVEKGPKSKSPSKDEVVLAMYRAVVIAIRRNFSYDCSEADKMCNQMKDKMEMTDDMMTDFVYPSIHNLLKANLNDFQSRFLMVITNHDLVHNRIYQMLNDSGDRNALKYQILIGSQFEKDRDSESYCVDVVSEIIHCMDQEMVLIMHQLDVVYTSLYDLFNQNFKIQGNKNYCRIVQGTLSKCLYPVHKKFKVILFLTKEQLNIADEPLVNRFEKYALSDSDFDSKRDKNYLKIFQDLLDSIFPFKDKKIQKEKIKQVFVNYSDVSLTQWIARVKALNLETNSQFDSNLNGLMMVLSEISSLHLTNYIESNRNLKRNNEFLDMFLNIKKNDILDFFQTKLKNRKSSMLVLYTFSSIYDNIADRLLKDCTNKMNPGNHENYSLEDKKRNQEREEFMRRIKFKEVLLTTIKSEKDFKEILKQFFENNEISIFVLKIQAFTETHHMFYLQSMISNMMVKHKTENVEKHCVLILYYKQSTLLRTPSFTLSSEFEDKCIDDLFNGLDETTISIFKDPKLASALKSSEENLKANFDSMIDMIIIDNKRKGKDQNHLDKIVKYFKDFSKKYGDKIKSLVIKKVINVLSEDKEIESKTIYEFINNPNDFKGNSEVLVKRIESLVNKTFQTKLKNVVELFLKERIIQALHYFSDNKTDPKFFEFIISMFKRLVNSNSLNEIPPNEELNYPNELLFPFSPTEYKTIIGLDRNIIKEYDDIDDSMLNSFFNTHVKCSFLQKNGYDLEVLTLNMNRLEYLLTDLINIHLYNSTSTVINQQILITILQRLIGERTEIVFKYFIADPDSITNLFVLLSNFAIIFGPEVGNYFKSIVGNNGLPDNSVMAFFEGCINQLIVFALNPSVILSNIANFTQLYLSLKHAIQTVKEKMTINIKSLKFELILIIVECSDKPLNEDSFVIKLLKNHPKVFEDFSIDDFDKSMESLRKVLGECRQTKEVEDVLLRYEVEYFCNVIEELKNEESNDSLKIIFEKVFKKMESNEDFDLLSGPIIGHLIDFCKIKGSIKLMLKKDIRYAENTDENNGIWLETNLSEYPKRLPYRILAILNSKIPLLLSKVEESMKPDLIRSTLVNINKFSSTEIKFKKIDLLHFGILKYFGVQLCETLIQNNRESSLVYSHLKELLESKSLSGQSLRMYFTKYIKWSNKWEMQELENFLVNSKEKWMEITNAEIQGQKTIRIPNSECFVIDADAHYAVILEFIRQFGIKKLREMNDCFEYLRTNNTSNCVLAFYSVFINFAYSESRCQGILVAEMLNKIEELKNVVTGIIGLIGFTFVKCLLKNFNQNSPLFIDKNSNELTVKRNVSILFGFASVISHKNQNDYLSSLFFPNRVESVNYSSLLSQSYLPGMIMPEKMELTLMKILIDSINKNPGLVDDNPQGKSFWRCSANCNYFFHFFNCGQPNTQIKPSKCPVCFQYDIGAKASHVAYDHHIRYTKTGGLKYMNDCLLAYKNSYQKGFFNSNLTIRNNNHDALTVSYQTTNVLNFMSNSMILVISQLNLPAFNINSLISERNPEELLSNRILNNFEQLKLNFKTNETYLIMNMFMTKLSSEFSNTQPVTTLDQYYAIEKQLESKVSEPLFKNIEKFMSEYRSNLHKSILNTAGINQFTSYLQESNKDNCNLLPLTKYLRLENRNLKIQEFIDRFNLSDVNKSKYPLTDYLFTHSKELESLNVVLMFKDFYDFFRENYSGKMLRAFAEEYKTNRNSFAMENRRINEKLNKFIDSWNKAIDNGLSGSFECQLAIKLSKINENSKLSSILPNRKRGDSGTDVMFGVMAIIKTQNQMLKICRNRNQGVSVHHSWDAISKDSLFVLDEKKLTKQINQKCIQTHLDYGRLGSMKIDFDKFEDILTEIISKLKMFNETVNLMPQFDYMYENIQLHSLLITLKNNIHQKCLTDTESKAFISLLNKEEERSSTCVFALIFDFCQNVLLPRAVLSADEQNESLVINFIKNTTSENLQKRTSIINCFEGLKMNQLYSFILLVEILMFQKQFEKNDQFHTRLLTNDDDRQWKNILKNKSPESLLNLKDRSLFLSNCWSHVRKAFMRLILRSSFNAENVEVSLEYFLKTETLYDLDFDSSLIDTFEIDENVWLNHCLVFWHQLEKLFKDLKNKHPINSSNQNKFGLKTKDFENYGFY